MEKEKKSIWFHSSLIQIPSEICQVSKLANNNSEYVLKILSEILSGLSNISLLKLAVKVINIYKYELKYLSQVQTGYHLTTVAYSEHH